MSNGTTHDNAGKLTTVLIIAGSIYSGLPTIPIAAGSIFGWRWASPDVDTHSNPVKRWGALSFIWGPLQSATRHRGITHHPLLGTPTVLGYLALLVWATGNGFRLALSAFGGGGFTLWMPFDFLWSVAGWILWFAIGVMLQHWVHLFLDWWSSRGKKMRKRKRKKKRL